MNREEFLKFLIDNKYPNVKVFAESIDVPYTTVRTILEKGVGNARVDNIIKMCQGLGISPEQLTEDFAISTIASDTLIKMNLLSEEKQEKVLQYTDTLLKKQNSKVVPLVGQSAANPTELSYGDTEHEDTITTNVPSSADCAIIIKGDSMEPLIKDGEIVFYRTQPDVENGQIAIVEIDGNGVTCKKVYFNYEEEIVVLKSLNDKYEDRELNPNQIRILGRVVK